MLTSMGVVVQQVGEQNRRIGRSVKCRAVSKIGGRAGFMAGQGGAGYSREGEGGRKRGHRRRRGRRRVTVAAAGKEAGGRPGGGRRGGRPASMPTGR
eukprot:1217150-Pleurochrysis_carterae.AAC.1